MSEPKDKSTQEWREWYVRHILGGECAEILKIAAADKVNLGIIIQFLKDLEEGNEP